MGLPIPTESGVVSTFDSDQSLGASYPRVVELEHYAAGKRQLIATFVRRGGFPIYRSTDRGETWQFVTEVKALTQQPALYEMPQKMGDFPAGTLLLPAGSSTTATNVSSLQRPRPSRGWRARPPGPVSRA